jgi:hypothetical protein
MIDHLLPSIPKELLSKWDKAWHAIVIPTDSRTYSEYMYAQCAQWGADQQLDQCVAWLDGYEHEGWAAEQMRTDCRLKPLSLKEQALESVKRFDEGQDVMGDLDTIRRALKALPND